MGRGHGIVSMSKDHLRFADVDGIDKASVVMDEVHYNIHRGIFFTASVYDNNIATESTLDLFIVVNSPIHARMSAAVSAAFTGQLFSDTVVTALTGTEVLPHNRNGFSSKVSDIEILKDPTVTNAGTGMVISYLPGGSKNFATGSTTSSFEEWILPSGNYLLRLVNLTAQAQQASVSLEFYQPNLA